MLFAASTSNRLEDVQPASDEQQDCHANGAKAHKKHHKPEDGTYEAGRKSAQTVEDEICGQSEY